MKIIIVGCGKVGYAIAGQLAQEKHDIVMVDNEIAHLSRADSTLDVMCVHGSGASISVLMDAGVRSATWSSPSPAWMTPTWSAASSPRVWAHVTPWPASATPSTDRMRTS